MTAPLGPWEMRVNKHMRERVVDVTWASIKWTRLPFTEVVFVGFAVPPAAVARERADVVDRLIQVFRMQCCCSLTERIWGRSAARPDEFVCRVETVDDILCEHVYERSRTRGFSEYLYMEVCVPAGPCPASPLHERQFEFMAGSGVENLTAWQSPTFWNKPRSFREFNYADYDVRDWCKWIRVGIVNKEEKGVKIVELKNVDYFEYELQLERRREIERELERQLERELERDASDDDEREASDDDGSESSSSSSSSTAKRSRHEE